MKKANFNIYRNNKDSLVVTPNPFTTIATPVGDPLPRVKSNFIEFGLGDINQNGTMTKSIS